MKKLLLIFLSIVASPSHAVEHQSRKWVDERAREITATYTKVQGENVLLKLADGRVVPFPIKKLRTADQQYIAAAAEQETPDDSPQQGEQGVNFDAPWPEKVAFRDDAEILVVSEDAEKKEFIYQSRNYEYKCDVRLNRSVVKTFSEMFEATYDYCRTVPLALDGNAKKEKKLPILLFETKESYIKAGAPPASAGVFMSGANLVMVPLDSLGVKPLGSGYIVDRSKSNKTLSHELTHQLTPRVYYREGSQGWFSEGIAEYISCTPYQNGVYRVKGNIGAIKSYVTAFGKDGDGGRNIGENISMGSLKDFMMQSYEEFLSDSGKNYGVGQLVTYYFIHLDGKGDGKRLKEFLKALRAGKKGEEALAVLLDGRTFAQLEKEIADKWRRERVTLTFTSK